MSDSAARDSARNHAILRVLGATPRQTFASFVVAQLGAGLLGSATVVGSAKDLDTISLPASVHALVAVAVPLLYLMIVIGPATRLTRRPVTRALTYE